MIAEAMIAEALSINRFGFCCTRIAPVLSRRVARVSGATMRPSKFADESSAEKNSGLEGSCRVQ
jgi:hypothetical protein